MNGKRWIQCLLFLLSVSAVKAGEGKKSDAGLWVCMSITPKLYGGKWKTTYALEYRSRENFRETSLWCASANVNYFFNPYVQVGAGYEFFLNKAANGRYSPEYRYYPEAILSYRLGAFAASLRSRLMNTFTRLSEPFWECRDRLKLTCQIAGRVALKPFIAIEPYRELYPTVRPLKKIRYYAGCSLSLGNRRQIDVYYLRENYLNKPFARNVIEVDYNYMF